MSETILVPHAAAGGKTWATVVAALQRGQLVCTFDDAENATLVNAGVKVGLATEIVNMENASCGCISCKRLRG